MTKVEISKLVSIIYAHHNAQVPAQAVELFSLEVMPNASLSEALESVRRYYAASTSGRWCTAGDVNAGIRRIRADRIPSPVDLEQEAYRLGLTGMDAWKWKKACVFNASRGLGFAEASREAAAQLQSAPLVESKHAPKTHVKGSQTGEHPAPYHLLGSPLKNLRKEP